MPSRPCANNMIIGIRLSTKNEFQHHPYSDQKTVEIVYHTRTPLVEKAFHPPPPPLLLRSDSTLCLYSGFFSNTLPTHTIISRPPPQLFTHFPFFHPAPRNPQPPAFIVPRQFSRGPFPRVSSNISVISSALFFSNSVMPILRHQRKGMVQHDRSAHWLWLTIWWNFCAA